MTTDSAREAALQARLEATGAAPPPMENGELLFEAPWEARAFGMAHQLCDAGLFDWNQFRDALIDEIGRHDRAAAAGTATGEYRYYLHWLAALERTLIAAGIADAATLAALRETLAARPHGHDH